MKQIKNKYLLASLLLLIAMSLIVAGCTPGNTNRMNNLNMNQSVRNQLEAEDFEHFAQVKDSSQPNEEDVDILPKDVEGDNKTTMIDLYFGYRSDDLIQREISSSPGIGRTAVNQLIMGPKIGEGKQRVIPEGTLLNSIRLIDDTMEVDFTRELRDNHWGGVYQEYRTVYGIVNTLTQFPQVKQVQILVEGEKIKTIASGYVDISKPLSRNMEITEDLISSRFFQLSRENRESKIIDWGSFIKGESGQRRHLTNGTVSSAVTGDITGNGQKEIVLTFKDYVEVWRYDRGAYRRLGRIDTEDGPYQVLVEDATGNGKGELILFTPSDLYIYSWNEEEFEQEWWQGPVGGEIVNLYLEDADLDGRNEIMILRRQAQGKDNPGFINTIEIWQYNGTTFVKKLSNTVFPFHNLLVRQTKPGQSVDIIGMGRSGIAAFNWNGLVYVERFRSPVIRGNITVGDTNGNGVMELTAIDENGRDIYFYDITSTGVKKKWQTGNLTGDIMHRVAAIADWDNDGKINTIVETNANGGYIVFYPVQGGGYGHYIIREGNGRILLVDDLNGDGKQEVLINYIKPGSTPAVYIFRLNKGLTVEEIGEVSP